MTTRRVPGPGAGAGETPSQFDLAVLGADDPMGSAVLQILEEREVPVGRLFPLSLREEGANVVFRGQDWPCDQAAEFDFGQAQALLVTSSSAAAGRLAEQVRAAHPAMPVLLVREVDPAPAIVVARILKSVAALAGVVHADAFVALPAAYAGQDGVEELANQTRDLFNMESSEPEVFPLQLAFNLMPYGDPKDAPVYESALAMATTRLAEVAEVTFSVVWAPLFFGAATQLHVRTASPVGAQALREAFRHRDGVTLMESDLAAGTPTPATDAQGSESVFIGRLRAEDRRISFWLVFDPIQLEAARMVDVLENWIDKPANSMLT